MTKKQPCSPRFFFKTEPLQGNLATHFPFCSCRPFIKLMQRVKSSFQWQVIHSKLSVKHVWNKITFGEVGTLHPKQHVQQELPRVFTSAEHWPAGSQKPRPGLPEKEGGAASNQLTAFLPLFLTNKHQLVSFNWRCLGCSVPTYIYYIFTRNYVDTDKVIGLYINMNKVTGILILLSCILLIKGQHEEYSVARFSLHRPLFCKEYKVSNASFPPLFYQHSPLTVTAGLVWRLLSSPGMYILQEALTVQGPGVPGAVPDRLWQALLPPAGRVLLAAGPPRPAP